MWQYKRPVNILHELSDLLPLGNLKNMENTHEGVLLFVKLQAKPHNFTNKVPIFQGCFLRFLNCTDGARSRNAPHLNLSDRLTKLWLPLRFRGELWLNYKGMLLKQDRC